MLLGSRVAMLGLVFWALLAALPGGASAARAAVQAHEAEQGFCGGLHPGGEVSDFDYEEVGVDDFIARRGAKGNKAKCVSCLGIDGCKYCPLTQTCVASGMFMGESCPMRAGYQEDRKIKDEKHCDRQPPWLDLMRYNYRVDNNSDPDPAHYDALRCIQWALGWPEILADPSMKDATDDELGLWGCTSAILRESILASIGRKTLPALAMLQRSQNDTHLPAATASALEVDAAAEAPESWEQETWEPGLCSVLKVKFPKAACYARGHKLQAFRLLQKKETSPNEYDGDDLDDRLAASIMSGPLTTLEPGAGKSGSAFASTADDLFKVKLGIKYNNRMNEPGNLMGIMEGNTKVNKEAVPLHEHLEKHPYSLLNRYYGMIKYNIAEVSSYVLVMSDAFYSLDATAEKVKEELKSDTGGTRGKPKDEAFAMQRYDLKGESRDQNEEKGKGFCLINGDFRRKEDNRLRLSSTQCDQLHRAVEADAHFLSAHDMIDYSILVLSVHRDKNLTRLSCDSTPGEPFCLENSQHLYTMSVIDYLNDFNAAKYLESKLFRNKFSLYAQKIINFVEKICPVAEIVSFKKRLQVLLKEHHQSVRDCFDHIDKDDDGKVSVAEINAYFDELGLLPIEEARLFAGLDDVDDDGMIDLYSFRQMFANYDMIQVAGFSDSALYSPRRKGQADTFWDVPDKSAACAAAGPALLLGPLALLGGLL